MFDCFECRLRGRTKFGTAATRQLVCLTIAFAACGLSPLSADELTETQKADAPEIESIAVKVKVINAEGEPVAEAKVTPSGMRTRAEPGSHYGWVEARHGKKPALLTDEDGVVEIACPKYVIEKLETGDITWLIDHEDYILFREDRLVDDDPAEVVLKRGRRIAVGAIDAETREPITENVHASLSGSGGSGEWNATSNGLLMSRGVDQKRTMLRVFQFPAGKPTKFSDPIDLSDRGNKSRILLRDVALQVGTRVEGKIDDTVPRPVKNGTVCVEVVEPLNHVDWQTRNTWSDWTKINEDGTFVIESLPRGSVVQMIAVCDGWVCEFPTNEALKAVGIEQDVSPHQFSRVMPQVVELNQAVVSPVIRMESTATCRITVVDPDGRPLKGATVVMNPNQRWLGGGNQFVGSGSSMRAFFSVSDEQRQAVVSWDKRRRRAELGIYSPGPDRYSTKTNDQGIAIIDTLPGGIDDAPRTESIAVEHDDFEQPPGDDGLSRDQSVALVRGKTQEITTRMDRKGTKVIGE